MSMPDVFYGAPVFMKIIAEILKQMMNRPPGATPQTQMLDSSYVMFQFVVKYILSIMVSEFSSSKLNLRDFKINVDTKVYKTILNILLSIMFLKVNESSLHVTNTGIKCCNINFSILWKFTTNTFTMNAMNSFQIHFKKGDHNSE